MFSERFNRRYVWVANRSEVTKRHKGLRKQSPMPNHNIFDWKNIVTEIILASKAKQQSSIPDDLQMLRNYKLDESVRLSLQVPKIKYPLGALPHDFANMLANVSPKIPSIVPGMPIHLAIEILEICLETAVAEQRTKQVI